MTSWPKMPLELYTRCYPILARYSAKPSTSQATEVIFYPPVSKASSMYN